MYMLYDNKGKIRLPNPNLGLYVVQNFLIEIAVTMVNQRAPQQGASERMTTIENAPGMELIPDQKKQRTCIIATTTPESFETHGFDMRNHKSQHRRHGQRVKITSGQTRLFIRAGTPLIYMELQDPDLRPNLM